MLFISLYYMYNFLKAICNSFFIALQWALDAVCLQLIPSRMFNAKSCSNVSIYHYLQSLILRILFVIKHSLRHCCTYIYSFRSEYWTFNFFLYMICLSNPIKWTYRLSSHRWNDGYLYRFMNFYTIL